MLFRSPDRGEARYDMMRQPPHAGRPCSFPHIKLPPYTGKENWSIWYAKFEAVAERCHWSQEEKLDNMLPKLEEKAGEFAFSQLAPEVLNNYSALVNELNCRFRVIETPQSFAAKFNRRVQKHSETVESFASELKRLYDKGHQHRDRQTRDEDLLRKFYNGLLDQEARIAVEFNKEPSSIDEAVYHVVNWFHMRGAAKGDQSHNKIQIGRAHV